MKMNFIFIVIFKIKSIPLVRFSQEFFCPSVFFFAYQVFIELSRFPLVVPLAKRGRAC